MVESAIMPGACLGPMRLVNVADKTASFSNDEGRAVVRRDDEIYNVKIVGPKDEMIFDGDIIKGDSVDQGSRTTGGGGFRSSAGLWIRHLMVE